MTVGDFWQAIGVYCGKLHGSVTSGYRTVSRNQSVGGVEHSFHLLGLAADVVYDVPVTQERRQRTAQQLGLRCIMEDDHDHLQPA